MNMTTFGCSWPSMSSLLNFNIADLTAQLLKISSDKMFSCSLVLFTAVKKKKNTTPNHPHTNLHSDFVLYPSPLYLELGKKTVSDRSTGTLSGSREYQLGNTDCQLEMERTITSSQDSCVCQNIAGNMCWNLNFTNNRHGRLRTWQIHTN